MIILIIAAVIFYACFLRRAPAAGNETQAINISFTLFGNNTNYNGSGTDRPAAETPPSLSDKVIEALKGR